MTGFYLKFNSRQKPVNAVVLLIEWCVNDGEIALLWVRC